MVIMKVLDLPRPVPADIIIKGPEFHLKQEMSLGKHLLEQLKKHGDAVSQIYTPTGQTNTFTDIRSKSIHVAEELRHRGIKLGDVIAICSFNHPEVVLPVLGGLYLGAIVAPLDPTLCKYDIKHLISISQPKLIFCETNCVKILEEAIDELNLTTELVVFGKSNKHACFTQFLQPRSNEHEFEAVDFKNPYDHVAFIMSSSGTTGLPKGVALSHGSILLQLQLAWHLPLKGVKMLNMSTLFWISGVLIALASLDLGMVRMLTPSFDALHTLKVIEEYKVFWIVVGVTYYMRLINHPDAPNYDLSNLRILSIGGAKVTDEQIAHGQSLFKGAQITAGYGLTETAGVTFQLNNAKPKSIGFVAPALEAKILDLETGKTVGPNVKGELCFRGGIVFKGYYRNAKATAEAIDKDGWLHTGDLCYYDNDHCFFIDGRIKEQFKCRGWQISPLEMEGVLLQHPELEEVAVIGVPHKIDVARARAYLVKKPKSPVTEEDIHNFMSERMNPNKQLHGGIVFVENLPITPSGKVQKRILIERAKSEIDEE